MSEQGLEGIDNRLSGLEDGQTRIASRLGALEASQTKVESRLNKIEASQTKTESRLNRIEASQTKTESRLDKVEIAIEGLRDDVQQVAEGHASVLAAIARSEQTVIDHIDSRIDPLEEAVRALHGSR